MIRAWIFMAGLLGAQICLGAEADRKQAQAQILDHADITCANCLFGSSKYYYCFAADDKVLVGYQSTRVLNFQDDSKNYLTKVHKGWTTWTAPGQSLPIGYDEKYIWVTRPDGKQVRLTQTYTHDVFSNDDRCRKATKSKAP